MVTTNLKRFHRAYVQTIEKPQPIKKLNILLFDFSFDYSDILSWELAF